MEDERAQDGREGLDLMTTENDNSTHTHYHTPFPGGGLGVGPSPINPLLLLG